MSVNTVAHLNFRGDARAALEFYQSVFGGDLRIVTYGDMGNVQEPAEADQVVWGQVATESGVCVMAFDVPARLPWDRGEHSFYMSLRGSDASEITGYWDRLAVNAAIVQPLGPSPWAPLYGMLRDQFGITWVVDVASDNSAA
ncbi:MAG: VOC family protein [Thermomicrobiales bacterium]